VTRAGDIVNISIEQLVAAGVKKIHARRLKSDPVVFLDAQEMSRAEEEDEDDPRATWGDTGSDVDDSVLGGELEALLQVAEKLGMSGGDLVRAKAVLAQKRRPQALVEWIESLGDDKFLAYVEPLASLGATRPGHLSGLSLNDMVAAGVKKLHARRLKTEPAVYHDAVALEEEGVAEDGGEDAAVEKLHDQFEKLLAGGGSRVSSDDMKRARHALGSV